MNEKQNEQNAELLFSNEATVSSEEVKNEPVLNETKQEDVLNYDFNFANKVVEDPNDTVVSPAEAVEASSKAPEEVLIHPAMELPTLKAEENTTDPSTLLNQEEVADPNAAILVQESMPVETENQIISKDEHKNNLIFIGVVLVIIVITIILLPFVWGLFSNIK